MSAIRLVTLDFACGPHVTEYGFDELTAALNGESSCDVHVSKIRPGVILLKWQVKTFVDAELTQILEHTQLFTSQFISVVLSLSKEDVRAIKKELPQERCSFEISGGTVGCDHTGELFRVTGKPDTVNRFLSTCRAITRTELTIVPEFTTEKKSFGMLRTSADISEVLETSEEDWEFLKSSHFDEMVSQIYPQVRLNFKKRGCIELSGDGGDVKSVIKEAYNFLDNRKVFTYYKSKSIVECLKRRWCTDLLRRRWQSAKITATVTVDEHKNTAVIKSGGELAIALRILESTIEEAQPISLPKELSFPVEASVWEAIEAAADGKAIAVLDEDFRQIIVAGNVEKLCDVVEQIRKLVDPGKPSNAIVRTLSITRSTVVDEKFQPVGVVAKAEKLSEASGQDRSSIDPGKSSSDSPRMVSASPSVIEVVKRYYDKRILDRVCGAAAGSSAAFFIRYTTDRFILEGDPIAADIAEKELTSLMTSMSEISYSPKYYFSRERVSQVERETHTFIQLNEQDYEELAMTVDSRRNAAVPRSGEEKERDEKRNATERVRTEHEGLMHRNSEGFICLDLKLRVLQGSVCDQSADVLVNSITPNLDLGAGEVSKAFDKAAGWHLQNELKSKVASSDFCVLLTKGYNLPCKRVFHVVCGPSSSQQADEKLKKLIYDCLETAELTKMTSIAFPPIGAGGLGYPIEIVVEAFYKAVEDFNQERHQHLKSITCAIFDNTTFKAFMKALQKLEDMQVGKLDSQKSAMYRNASEHGEKGADFFATPGLPTGWKITGRTSNVYRAMQQLDDLGSSQAINQQAEAGSGDYGMTYVEDRHQLRSTSQSTLSYYERQPGADSSFGVKTTAYPQTKEGYNAPTSQSAHDVTGDAVLVNRIASQLVDTQSNYARYWKSMSNEMCSIFPIDAQQPEYRDVKSFIKDRRGILNTDTMQIFRIQDKIQWKLYCEQHEMMKRGNLDGSRLQRLLWFSCPQDDVFGLLKAGHLLSRSNSVRRDFGKGAYFYRDATDAATVQIAAASTRGVNYIVLASVLTGRLVVGNASMVTLPQLPASDKKYDSSVDNLDDPKLFVIYHDAQACPLYCIYFNAFKT